MEPIFARFVGGARHMSGVPARDLTKAEWGALGQEMQSACLAEGLYELVGDSTKVIRMHERADDDEPNAEG